MKRVIPVAWLAVIIMMTYPIVKYGLLYNEDPLTSLLIPFFGNDTVWADGYSLSKFKSIEPGMNQTQVKEILGECLVETPFDDVTYWHYTTGIDGRPMSYSRYSTHRRFVRFNNEGVVTGVTIDFYFD